MEEIRVMIGQTIATRRKALGLTQKQLAEKLGISNQAVSKWENLEANPDIGLLVPLSEILQTTTDNLLRGTETEDTITENKNYSKKGERRVSAKTKIGYICVTGFLGVTMLAALVTFVSILVSLLSVLLNAGYYRYHLAVRRGEEVPYLGLFDGFSFAGKLILLALVQYIFIFLWTLLFIIPGFIAAYRYRFAVYNLCENPDMGVMEAINMSKAQTAGFKWQLFVLDLSFIGWRILSGLTLNILAIWMNPYIVQTDVGFFQQIKAAKGIGWSPDRGGSGEFRPYDGPDHTDNTGW